MMITRWLDSMVKRMRWYDLTLTKLAVFFFTLFLVTAWPGLRAWALATEWYWFLLLAILVSIPVMRKLF